MQLEKKKTVDANIKQFSDFPKPHCSNHTSNSPLSSSGNNHTNEENASKQI